MNKKFTKVYIKIQHEDFDVSKETQKLHHNRTGAIDKIVQKSIKKWDLTGITVIHRVGKLFVSDQIVFVGVSSMHRQNAFDACNFIMDWLKTKAPFWKVEENNNHRSWVSSRQSDQEATKKWEN